MLRNKAQNPFAMSAEQPCNIYRISRLVIDVFGSRSVRTISWPVI
jgi:hypothetical protein